jgi:predicted ABC-type sugar transport system permease subunit
MNQKIALGLATGLTVFFVIAVSSIVAMIAMPSATPQARTVPQATLAGIANVTNTNPSQVTAERAAQIAQNAMPRARIVNTRLVDFQGTVAYEVTLDQGTLYIDANQGTLIASNTTNVSSNRRGEREHEEHEENDDD